MVVVELTVHDGYVVDASDLSLGPGEWPETIHILAGGENAMFARSFPLFFRGEFSGYRYASKSGKKLTVLHNNLLMVRHVKARGESCV